MPVGVSFCVVFMYSMDMNKNRTGMKEGALGHIVYVKLSLQFLHLAHFCVSLERGEIYRFRFLDLLRAESAVGP